MGTFSKPPRGSSSSSARLSSHAALLRRRVYQTNPGQVPCWAIIIRRLCIIITIIIIIITTTTTDGSHFIQPLSVKSSLALLCWVLSVKVPEVFCFFNFLFFYCQWTWSPALDWRLAPMTESTSRSSWISFSLFSSRKDTSESRMSTTSIICCRTRSSSVCCSAVLSDTRKPKQKLHHRRVLLLIWKSSHYPDFVPAKDDIKFPTPCCQQSYLFSYMT